MAGRSNSATGPAMSRSAGRREDGEFEGARRDGIALPKLHHGRAAWCFGCLAAGRRGSFLPQLFAQCRLIAESYIIRVRGVGSTASILPRSRRAVSCFSIQIGRRMSTTWPAVCGSLPITGKGIGGEGRSPLLPMHGIAPTGRMSVEIFVNTPGEGLDPNRRSLPGELHSFLRGNGNQPSCGATGVLHHAVHGPPRKTRRGPIQGHAIAPCRQGVPVNPAAGEFTLDLQIQALPG